MTVWKMSQVQGQFWYKLYVLVCTLLMQLSYFVSDKACEVKGEKSAGFCEANWTYKSDRGDEIKFELGIPKWEDNFWKITGRYPNFRVETTGGNTDGPVLYLTTVLTQIS